VATAACFFRTSALDAGGGTTLEAAAARIAAARRLIGIVSVEREGRILREESRSRV
jgi:hypothetical protein